MAGLTRRTNAAFARPVRLPEPGPVINTTPLIDLMLVLLVMLILAVPTLTHKLPVDLPSDGLRAEPAPVHLLALDAAGNPSWDGQAVTPFVLDSRLAAMARDPARPVLHFAPDAETRYERVDQTLAAIRRAGITRMGFVDNSRFARSIG